LKVDDKAIADSQLQIDIAVDQKADALDFVDENALTIVIVAR